jgi:hypothetical protein
LFYSHRRNDTVFSNTCVPDANKVGLMNANVATELNYLWKVKAVGGAYMDPAVEVLRKDSPSGEILVLTILTEDRNIKSMWVDGTLSL